MKIVAAITYTTELTLPLALESIRQQTVKVDGDVHIIDNVYPMRTAINKALDYGHENGDILLHIAADVILNPTALEILLHGMDDDVFMSRGLSMDSILGVSTGGRIYNMNLLQDKYRLGHTLVADMDFVETVCRETGWKWARVEHIISTHRPIWTPEELWMKVRFSLPKYEKKPHVLNGFNSFFMKNLADEPDNKTLQIGYEQFKVMAPELGKWALNDKHVVELKPEYEDFVNDWKLDGNEFWALNGYKGMARRMLNARN